MTLLTRTAPHLLAGYRTPKVALARVIAGWLERRRSRIALSHLSEVHLRDIGLDPLMRDHEAARPFWK